MPVVCPHCHNAIEEVENTSRASAVEASRKSWQKTSLALTVLLLFVAMVVIAIIGYVSTRRARDEAQAVRQLAAEQEVSARQALVEKTMARDELAEKEQQARLSLRRSLLRQAEALHQSSMPGRRALALEALKSAAAIQPGDDLRDSYVRCLNIPDPSSPARVVNITTPIMSPAADPQITFLQFSPKERWLACTVKDSDLHVIDLADPNLARTRLASGLCRAGLAFSAEGDQLWSADEASPDELWQLPSPTPTRATRDPTRAPQSIALNSRGEHIAAGQEFAVELVMVDLARSKVLWSYLERALPAAPPLFSPDGKQLATALITPVGPKVKVWASQTRALTFERSERPAELFYRNEHLQALVEPRTLAIKDLQDLSSMPGLRPAPSSFTSAEDQFLFSADGCLCAESNPDKAEIAIWDLNKKALRTTLRGTIQSKAAHTKAFSRDGSMLAVFRGNGIQVWDTLQGNRLVELPIKAYHFAFAKLDDNGDQLVVVEKNGTVSTWRPGASAAAKLTLLRLDAKQELGPDPSALLIAETGKRALYLDFQKEPATASTWDLTSGQRLAQFPVPLKYTSGSLSAARPRLALSPDGNRLAVVSPSVSFKIWDRDSARELLSASSPDRATKVSQLVLSHDGECALGVFQKGNKWTAKVFDLVERGEMLAVDLEGPARCGVLTDRAALAAVSQQKQVWVYETRSQQKVSVLADHRGDVSDIAFDREGKTLATICTEDEAVRLWNPRTGQLLGTFSTGPAHLSRVTVSPSGRWLAAGDREGNVWLWNLAEERRQLQEVGLDWPAAALVEIRKPRAGTAEALLEEAQGHHLFGRYAQAVQAYDQALKLNDNQAQAHRDRGEALFQLRRVIEAAADFEKAKELSPELPSSPGFIAALLARGLVHAESARWTESQADFQKAIKEGAEKGKSQHEVARLRLGIADIPNYRRACQSLAEQLADREAPATIQKAVWTCVLAPNTFPEYARLIERAEDTVDTHPKDALYHRTLGALLTRAGQYDTAIQRLNHALELRGGEGQPQDWLFLAIAYQQAGHPDDAKKWLDRAVQGIRTVNGQNRARLEWQERLELLLLQREAEKLIRGTTGGTSKGTSSRVR
jgi:WD40 repeat protein/Tfp pilus assembly protein PilF